jgi:DNA polymerase-4
MSHALCRDCCTMTDALPPQETCPRCGSERLVRHAELDGLSLAHVDCDAFYASVERRDRPELRDQPLIVGRGDGRGVVTTACYLARRFGVHSAMPMFKALSLCPAAAVVPPDMAKYKEASAEIRAIFLAATEIVEPVSLDEAYLDLSASLRPGETLPAQALADIARRVEREVGVTVSIGLSYNKFLAKLASDLDKPRGFSVIGRAEARLLLAPLPVTKINGVGDAAARRLEACGVTSIGQLQGLSEMQLVTQFGKFGRSLARFAQGEDDRKVTPQRPAKSVSAETTFRQDTSAVDELLAALQPLCERVAAQLERRRLSGRVVVLKLKTSDFQVLTRSKRLDYPTQRASVLAQQAGLLLVKHAERRRFRLIGVGVDDLHSAADADPPDLFGGL